MLGMTMITTAANCTVQLVEYCPLKRVRKVDMKPDRIKTDVGSAKAT